MELGGYSREIIIRLSNGIKVRWKIQKFNLNPATEQVFPVTAWFWCVTAMLKGLGAFWN
tara:strand:- start:537 stop:713 length:177 start_codon:yes stop_codon:yes gene_type:complete